MDNVDVISFFNEDGSVRSKEDFLKDAESIYEQACLSCAESEDVYNPDNLIEPESVINSFDFKTRAIFLSDEITPEMSTSIVKQIRLWNIVDSMDKVPIEERIPIKIYIDTLGGDLTEVFCIIGAIQISKTPVYTITCGTGYSGGFLIGINGHKRFGFPHSSYLFHEGMTLDGADAHKFLQYADFYKLQLKKIEDITIDKTKISKDFYQEKKKDDWFFTAEEALKYGIIDEIIESLQEV